MGYAVEQRWRAKQGKRRLIVPYGEIAASSVLPTLSGAQAMREFDTDIGRRRVAPRYMLELKTRVGWVTAADMRPKSLEGAVRLAALGPYRVVERQWDGSYEPVPTGNVNAAWRADAPTTKSDGSGAVSVSGAPKTGSGFKGKRKFW